MRVLHASAGKRGQALASGILSIDNAGYGFLRQNGNQQGPATYTSPSPRSGGSGSGPATR